MTQDLLCYFVSFLGEKGLGHSTIKSYLAAVRSLQIDYQGRRWELRNGGALYARENFF